MDNLELLSNFQKQVLTKLAMCERPSEDADLRKFMHLLVPFGLQPYDQS